uniref:TEA domain-containing protein n=1 Tax=Mycena chlorophos TaxID=658473 RepID=A0ABQ0L7E8_MYCCL|nr:predicted protein [Mycena chlorophos]
MPSGGAGATLEFLPEPSILGRRSYKIPKGESSPVWTSKLEDALVHALDAYDPAPRVGPHRTFQRNPRRNRFISDYIFSATGTRRTPKQVGSRLQQMRETCQDQRILKLIKGSVTPSHEKIVSLDGESASSPSTSSSDFEEIRLTEILPPKTDVTIQLQPSTQRGRRSSVTIRGDDARSIRVDCPEDMSSVPLVTVVMPFQISLSHYYSYFRVVLDTEVIHADVTGLNWVSTTADGVAFAYGYSTPLIPVYWAKLSRSSELYHCVVEQDIMQTSVQFDEGVLPSPQPSDRPIRSIVYHFTPPDKSPNLYFRPPNLAAEPVLPPEFPGSRTDRPVSFSQPEDSRLPRIFRPRAKPLEEQDPSALYTHDCDWTAGAAAAADPSNYAALAGGGSPPPSPPLPLHYSYDGYILQHPTPSYPAPPSGTSLASEWSALYEYEFSSPRAQELDPTVFVSDPLTSTPLVNSVDVAIASPLVPYFYHSPL